MTSKTSSVLILKKKGQKRTSVEDLATQGFNIGPQLGEGSYCKVKAASYNGKAIAVKVITRAHLSMDFETRFLPREIDILSRIDHPNIIRIYKIFSYPKRVYIFMELVDRSDMLGFIRERGRLMEPEACYYFIQMVSAIQYLHNMNVAHRDLKCENIMITENDEIKIIDFGFCRSTVNEDNRRVLSSTYCGSTAYAAPEVLQGIPYNPMMYDVWSLGCVLFIMVTGTMPFDDGNVRKMVTCQLKRQFRYPTTFNVTKSAKRIISRMLEPDVTRRSTLRQISRCDWILQHRDSYKPSTSDDMSTDEGNHLEHKESTSTGTQTFLGDFSFFRKKG